MLPDKPIPFGDKMWWYAVKTTDNRALARLLTDHFDTCEYSWEMAVKHPRIFDNYGIFLTPPIKGWTLVLKQDFDINLLQQLSSVYGEAQFFEAFSITSTYEYAVAISGNVTRHVRIEGYYIQERDCSQCFVMKNIGNSFPHEADYFFCTEAMYDDLEAKNDLHLLDKYPIFDENFIIKSAAALSVNPSTIDEIAEINPSYVLVFCALDLY